jgi:hypothetical protein
VKTLQDVQEELVEQSVLLYGDEEGQAFVVIFGRDAVHRVVLLEVEQAACTKGKNDNGVRMREAITKMNVS